MNLAPAPPLQTDHATPSPPLPARRCRLTVLFSDVCNSTALSSALEAEDYADLLAAWRGACETVVARHGGTVVRIQGDGMLAVFGYPQPREGDGRRAVEAALQLHGALAQLDVPAPAGGARGLRLHSGLHSGMVLVQPGNMVIGRLELLGRVPNIASRVAASALQGEILVSDETLGPDRFSFETGASRPVPLELHADAQAVSLACWPILGRAPAISPFEARIKRGLQPFLGRRDELHRLEDRLGEALLGTPRQVAIAGPPGVGKTRLARQFLLLASWKGCRVLKGYCESELDTMPMQPLLHITREAMGLAPTASSPGTPGTPAAHEPAAALLQRLGLEALGGSLLPFVAGGAASPGQASTASPLLAGAARAATPEALAQALVALFAALAAQQPLVLFIDDWQWSDTATRQTLAALGAAAAGSALMVLYSTRGMDARDASLLQVEVMPLEPFSKNEATSSVRALLPQADPFTAEQIYRYSGGNALFIEELCHSAGHEAPGATERPTGAAWLQVLIESRVARLPAAQASWLRTIAVIGNLIPEWLLCELTGLEPEDGVLQALAARDFLYPEADGGFRFKHGLTRDVIYESVGLHERRELHLRIALALQRRAATAQEVPHEALAYHYGAAGSLAGAAPQAAHHAELAGDRAAAMSALDLAKSLYHAALAHLQAAGPGADATSRWLGIANKLGLICVFDASRKDLPVFEQAVALARNAGDPSMEARAEYWLGYIRYALGESPDAVRHCRRALELAGTGADPLSVQIRATLGQVLAGACDYAGAAPLLEEAVDIKRRHRRGNRPPVGLAYSLVCLASVAGDRGEFARAHDCFDEAWALLNGVRHEIGASIQGWRAVVLTWQGRWADAVAAAAESTRIAEQTHSLFQFCQGRATGAYAQWMHSGDAHAIGVLAESTQWLEPRESGLFRSLDHGWLAEGCLAQGDRMAARRYAAQALRRARAGDLIGVAMAFRALARDAAAQGDPSRARRCLAQAGGIGLRRESAHEAAATELCTAEVALLLGEPVPARRHADTALAAFERLQMHWHAERVRALLARA